MTPARRLTSYGPVQFPEHLGITVWQFRRALTDGLIPAPEPATARWPAAVFQAALANLDRIRAAVGSQPDVGASRAAEVLAERFDLAVAPDVLIELDRMGLITEVGDYKGYPLYDSRALEQFHARDSLLRAITNGRLLQRDQVAAYLQVRPSDVEHLVRSRWLEPVTWVRSSWQRRRTHPTVPLFRVGDLDVLLAHPGIDWPAVRATPKGRPSPLARLTGRTTSTGQ